MKTYSFQDVQAAIVGPGGAFNIGNGAGVADEGITVVAASEMNTMTIGADGLGMHTLHADRSGKITLRVLKTSPVNALLMAMLQFQRVSAANHGQNTITITHTSLGDVTTAQQVAFSKVPDNAYAKNADIREWNFDAIIVDFAPGK